MLYRRFRTHKCRFYRNSHDYTQTYTCLHAVRAMSRRTAAVGWRRGAAVIARVLSTWCESASSHVHVYVHMRDFLIYLDFPLFFLRAV